MLTPKNGVVTYCTGVTFSVALLKSSMTELDRRHLLATLGAGLMTPRRVFAEAPLQDIAQRLAGVQQDGKVDGLHTLLVSQGGRLMIEYYGRGDDESQSSSTIATISRVCCA